MSEGDITRFLFEGQDIRGAFVHLEACWQSLQQGRHYGPVEAGLLGEMATVAVLIAAQLKQPGRLTFQVRGTGPVSLLVMDCDEQLRFKGMARAAPDIQPAPVPELLGASEGGQLMLSLDLPGVRQPYRSFVPLEGDSIAAIFEYYLEQSEQQEARLFIAADEKAAGCLFLQKMPAADFKYPDGWARIGHLASTVKAEELLRLDAEHLLRRLFDEEIQGENNEPGRPSGGIRVFPPRPVRHHCPEDREKIAAILLALGREKVEDILSEHGEIRLKDELCNREYCFDAREIDALFTGQGSGIRCQESDVRDQETDVRDQESARTPPTSSLRGP